MSVALSSLLGTAGAEAAFLPYGVQQNVAYSTVTDTWGWSQIYRGDYGTSVSMDIAFGARSNYVMLGAIQDGSSTISLLAAIAWDDFVVHTPWNVTKSVNGAEWYYNGYSLGFAALGDSIYQSTADVEGSDIDLDGSGTSPEQRLSWHTSGGHASTPTSLNGGWRAGEATWLNHSTAWDRVVFTANAITPEPVPLPAAVWLLGSALGGVVGISRRRAA